MSKFDVKPPVKSEVVPVPEWLEQFGEVVVSESFGPKSQDIIDIIAEFQSEGGAKNERLGKLRMISACCTVGGETPPIEWLEQAPLRIQGMLYNKVLEINGLSNAAQETIEKN